MEPIEKWLCHTCGQSGMGTGRDHVCPMVTPHARDPDLRKAALDALLAWNVYMADVDGGLPRAEKAMDALREALAK